MKTLQSTVDGELTIISAVEQNQRLQALLTGDTAVEVDLSGVTEVDTSGLQVLLLAKREAERLGVPLVFQSPGEQLRSMLELTGLMEEVCAA
ncbi:STAS domain-containing protein [Virgisporangium aurantiacum]|uniref:Sulfate transporter n=1 Tax=Virgisporangium aurantiacum TaxID=175570 RepID=A0A8J3YZ53_9ACTN|nr:STAS domain-containing protein [Virgisporangium aurantiacum]GIJ53343.1 sulfate transporter [Virgisporangium aurantiacum]